jgi:GT2 family glycosyltransferase
MIAITIVEFNTKDLLKSCLNSIYKSKPKTKFEVWVVDNASGDESVQMVKEDFKDVNLIESKKNLGFGAGHNLALKKAQSPYYLILNSDTTIEKGTIDEMVQFMEDHPNCGIASCKVLGFDGKLQPNGGDLPFGWALFSWLFNLESLIKSSFHRNDKEYYSFAHPVGWVSGNFMVIRKELFDKIDYFNEDYFMYFEDVEISYRAKKAGFEVWVNPEVSIKHLSGGSLDNPKYRQWKGELEGLVRFYKQFGLGSVIRLIVYLATLIRIFAFALIGKFDYAKTYAKVITKI